jgi:hypothetical protein
MAGLTRGLAGAMHIRENGKRVTRAKTHRKRPEIVTLADLIPNREIKAGTSRLVFGAEPIRTAKGRPAGDTPPPSRSTKTKR